MSGKIYLIGIQNFEKIRKGDYADNDMVSLHVADPERTETDIRISICYPAQSKEVKTIHCDFRDSGVYAGATKVYNIRF